MHLRHCQGGSQADARGSDSIVYVVGRYHQHEYKGRDERLKGGAQGEAEPYDDLQGESGEGEGCISVRAAI